MISINEALELIDRAWITCLSAPESRYYDSARTQLQYWTGLKA